MARPSSPRPPTLAFAAFHRSDGDPLLFAHRGARVELPENTLEAFERALALGADALETDVHLTADGEVVVFHDETGQRLAGRAARVAACSLREIQSWDLGHVLVDSRGRGAEQRPHLGRGYRAPTLAAVLQAFPDTPLNVDLKPRSAALVAAAVRVVRDQRAAHRVLLTSFHRDNILTARALGYEGPTGAGTRDVLHLLTLSAPRLASRLPRRLALPRPSAVQIPYQTAGITLPVPRLLELCRTLGARLDVFTVNDGPLARRYRDLGVDGIMTDDPRLVVAALGRRGRAPHLAARERRSQET
jgi:glycerophosphoryl diester phosphodiesterase